MDHDFSSSPTDQMNVHKFLVKREAVRKSGIPLLRGSLISYPFCLHRFVFSYPVSGKYLLDEFLQEIYRNPKEMDQNRRFHGKTSGPTSKLGMLMFHDFFPKLSKGWVAFTYHSRSFSQDLVVPKVSKGAKPKKIPLVSFSEKIPPQKKSTL